MENRTTIQVSEDLRKKLRVLAASRDKSYQELLEDMIGVFQELDYDQTIISIPSKLGERIEENLEGIDFKTLSEYVTFLLRIMLYEQMESTEQDVEKVRARLKKLGYLE